MQLDSVRPDLDGLSAEQPSRSDRYPAAPDAGPTPQIDEEDPPGNDLEIGVPPTYVFVAQDHVRSRIAPEQRELEGEDRGERLPFVPQRHDLEGQWLPGEARRRKRFQLKTCHEC
jgi:hypothetical protein